MKTECQAVSALFLSMWMMGPNKVEVNVEAICGKRRTSCLITRHVSPHGMSRTT
jgi:hypothetical protein